LADVVIVFDDEDAVAAPDADGFVAGRRNLASDGGTGGLRQVDGEVAPLPGTLATSMSPSDWLAKPNAWLRPSPVPLPTSLVVKNGSKIASI